MLLLQSAGGCGATNGPWGGEDDIADRLAPLESWPGGTARPPALLLLLLLALHHIVHTAGTQLFQSVLSALVVLFSILIRQRGEGGGRYPLNCIVYVYDYAP